MDNIDKKIEKLEKRIDKIESILRANGLNKDEGVRSFPPANDKEKKE